MIVKCIGGFVCKSEYQDKTYGPDNRVANPTKDPEKARCTVCGTLIKIPRGKEETKK